MFDLVAVELPEKQGLKHLWMFVFLVRIVRCSGTSRKTRIETLFPYSHTLLYTLLYTLVAVELPEKQGLKHHFVSIVHTAKLVVAVELPEKQGLKLIQYRRNMGSSPGCSGTSRKTRIETDKAYYI